MERMQAQLRSDRYETPNLHEYRFLTMEECKALKGGNRVKCLDIGGRIGEITVTSVKTWKRKPDVEVRCKFGLYEYFTVTVSDSEPSHELIKIVLTRYPAKRLPGLTKAEAFGDLGITWDGALPQELLERMAAENPALTYSLLLSTTVWAYPTGNHFGTPYSCCLEVQAMWDKSFEPAHHEPVSS